MNKNHKAIFIGLGVFIGMVVSWLFRREEDRGLKTPIGVGDARAQREFIRKNKLFIHEYPKLHALLIKVFIRTLDRPEIEPEFENLSDIEIIAVEDKLMARFLLFYLGRAAADDFGELIILSGNGRGIGAYKILRGMYERIVKAAFIAKNPSEARHFLAHSDIQKGKLWKRLVEIMPEIANRYSAEQIQDLLDRQRKAQVNLKSERCNKCNQPVTQDEWTRVSLDT